MQLEVIATITDYKGCNNRMRYAINDCKDMIEFYEDLQSLANFLQIDVKDFMKLVDKVEGE